MSGSLNYGVQSSYRFNIWTLEQGVVTAETEQGKEKNEKKKEKKIKIQKNLPFSLENLLFQKVYCCSNLQHKTPSCGRILAPESAKAGRKREK